MFVPPFGGPSLEARLLGSKFSGIPHTVAVQFLCMVGGAGIEPA